jgi:phosphate acyltransferase
MTRSERPAARIAVDLLGGDDAPAVVVDGALQALDADAALRLLPVGPPAVVDGLVARLGAARRDRVDPVPIDGVPPVRRAAQLVGIGYADAVVSAGATGATVTAAVAGCGRYPGLARPALAVTVPAPRGPLVLLDVGASPTPTGADLARHAVLGVGYAAATLGLAAPRVGLLSIGTERGSGDMLRREAAALLSGLPLPGGGRYVGLVEGHDVPLGGPADVVVTDGFTGNVLLKGIEGAMRLPGSAVLPADRAATLLGVPATVVVCHGAAAGADLASGIALAARLVADRSIEVVSALDEAVRSGLPPVSTAHPTPASGGAPA